jgi:uncharacterized protein (TIGR00255 family)
MTGYGEGVWDNGSGQYHISAKSFNHRYLDVRVRLPRRFDPWELDTTKAIKERFDRGHIELSVGEVPGEMKVGKPAVDLELAGEYVRILNSLKDEFDIKDDVGIDTLVRMKGVIHTAEEVGDLEGLWEDYKSVLDGVLDRMAEERKREGRRLREDMEERIARVVEIVLKIEKAAPEMVEGYRARLTQKIDKLLEKPVDPGRIEQEVVIYTDRSDITEECVRLKSHVEGFGNTLKAGSPAGKKLDFLLQEMSREVNTIGNKATTEKISGLMLEAKVEIEKMRQQVQNIE